MKCRNCNSPLEVTFLDLGLSPPSNAYLNAIDSVEKVFPLKLMVCSHCWLVQTVDYISSEELFGNDYAYFSSMSETFLKHSADYVNNISSRLNLGEQSLVIEVASNDGYLLNNFVRKQIPCLGIEPTESTASVAEKKGIPILHRFFSRQLAENLAEGGRHADLVIGNNVYAHVPDINDFTEALKVVLKPHGTITLEFPHLLELIKNNQFDTVYHEHFSYLSLLTVDKIFKSHQLRVFDVEKITTHGGSLRVYGCHGDDVRPNSDAVNEIIQDEVSFGLKQLPTYQAFQDKADKIKNEFLSFLRSVKKQRKNIIAYGAAAKGNTLLNYCGVTADDIPFVCDAAPSKQGKFMPGSHIPIGNPQMVRELKPDYLLILPWNIAEEVMNKNSYISEWGGKFVMAIPELRII